ncbi:hypothetical protein P5W99_31525 [Paraburkholderia sp. A3BS-1L]|uniref:hypothetical protein n=1 Tax=Paraburkholderia sp. A3BS-1L TaxID=3028375 RepID=UPI003DAA0365
MIRRLRNRENPPPSLSSPEANAERIDNRKLADAAKAAGNSIHDAVKAMKFNAYSALDVHNWLWAQFGQKCAYCEASASNTDVHVDHHRPKGDLDAADNPNNDHPGYWWLGSDWENLLPACGHCNRSPQYDPASGRRYKSGKSDRFPLLEGSARCMFEGEDVEEQPALLDPSIDEPSFFFAVRIHRTLPLIGVRRGRDDAERIRAKESIKIYGLNRPGLVRDRALHVSSLLLTLDQLAENLDDLNAAADANAKEKYEKRSQATWKKLYERYLGSHELPFLMTSIRIVEKWFEQRGMRLGDHLPHDYDLVPLHLDDQPNEAVVNAAPAAAAQHPERILPASVVNFRALDQVRSHFVRWQQEHEPRAAVIKEAIKEVLNAIDIAIRVDPADQAGWYEAVAVLRGELDSVRRRTQRFVRFPNFVDEQKGYLVARDVI